MALKQCSLCDRKFTKLEHVKRHERSHTRERPYECPTCKKHFSRSDVLFRHCKGHAQNALNRLSNSRQNQQGQDQTQNSSLDKQTPLSTTPQIEPGSITDRSPRNHPLQQDPSQLPLSKRRRESHQISPTHIDNFQHQQHQHLSPIHPHLRHPPTTQQPSPNDSRLEALINAAQHLGTPADVPWRSPSPINLHAENDRFMARNNQETMPPPIDPAIDMLSFSPHGHVSSLDQWAFELVQSNHPMPNRTPADALQTWLFPMDGDVTNNGAYQMAIDQRFEHDAFRVNVENRMSPSGSSVSIASRIPRERFARVESCWPSRNRKAARLMPILWSSLVSCESTNILSEIPAGAVETPISERERRNSRWGLDDECRDVLQGALNNAAPRAPSLRSDSCGDTSSSIGDVAASPGGENIQFPPAEILDIALEMYLYYFHPTLPIIHVPTFSAKNAPRPLLLCMCLIGLCILGTAGASKFVSRTFPSVLQIVSDEVQSLSKDNDVPEKQLRILATGLLAVNLASMTGVRKGNGDKQNLTNDAQRKSRITQAEKLYSDLITTAQNNGLFSANESAPPESYLEEILDIDTRWKAWCRIDCTKRIIFGLLEADCWYAAYLATSPLIRPETVQILPPSEYTLYHANTASKWLHLVQRGARMHSPRISPSYLPTAGLKLDPSTLRSLLTLFLLRIYESNARLTNNTSSHGATAHKHLEPWRIYADDARSRELLPLLANLSSSSIDALRTADLNSAVLWHASCMLLGANMSHFELAAGRAGPGPAVAALEDISTWSQTPSARRAVLHAAHIYKLLFDRKVSDIVNPHSVMALFQAALVLGLYIFTLPPPPPSSAVGNSDHCLELLELVDWSYIGQLGYTNLDRGGHVGTSPVIDNSPIASFIRRGGAFSITGIALDGGYLAARRTLLHCADLMDGIARWKARTFSQILHIMSDDLTETEVADSGDDEDGIGGGGISGLSGSGVGLMSARTASGATATASDAAGTSTGAGAGGSAS